MSACLKRAFSMIKDLDNEIGIDLILNYNNTEIFDIT